MKRFYIFLFILLFGSLQYAFAQQLPLSNQHIINKFSLSPAYAGYNQNIEVFAGFRQDLASIPGAPEARFLSLTMPQYDNMGIGLNLTQQKAGIFNDLAAMLNYAYHLEISRDNFLSFGIGAGFFNNRIDYQDILVQGPGTVDPYLASNSDLHGTTFDVAVGIMYSNQGFTAGIAMPRVLGKINYIADSDAAYTLKRHYLVHATYDMSLDYDWNIEPVAIVRTTEQSPLMFEAGITVNYQDKVWVTPVYRQGNAMSISVGTAINERLVANYTFEFSGSELQAMSNGSHEVGIGFLIKDGKSERPSVFGWTSAQATGSDLEKRVKALEDDPCCDENEQQIETLRRQIDILQNQLDQCCRDSTEIQNLLEQIQILELEIEDLKREGLGDIEYEAPVILKNIHFATDSDELVPSSFPELDKIVQQMEQKPEIMVKIVGHTDNVGEPMYNLLLSKRRALAVKNYLVSKGIAPDRIITDGKGMNAPIDTNATPEGRANNRRIEASFTKE